MTVSALAQPTGSSTGSSTGIVSAATLPAADLLGELGVAADLGLSSVEVGRRQAQCGSNAVSSHRARLLPVLWHQLRSPLLALLVTAAIASYFVGERSGAVIIGVIVALSVGLGFVNEYRAEKAAEALHSQISHKTVVIRDGRPAAVDVTTLVPGDLIELRLGEIVPADIRLIEVTGLEQLRQHVLRRRCVAVPDVSADAAVADPAQQPALRHQPASHPDRQRR